MKNESCEPPVDIDWQEAAILEVILSAEEGVPAAKTELLRRQKQLDTVSGKASGPSAIIEWIED
jgi:hypothetical protein